MSAAHTKGPWFAGAMGESGWIDVYTMEGDGFRSLPFAACKHFDQEANARLIAAAPELLALLREATDALAGGLWDYGPEQDEHIKCDEVIERCRAAIAKAGGSE